MIEDLHYWPLVKRIHDKGAILWKAFPKISWHHHIFFYQTLMYQLFWVDQYNRFDFNSCMDRYLHYWVWDKIVSSFPNYKVIFCEKLWFVFPDQRIILSKWSMISRETPRHFESECFYKRYYDPGGVMRAPLGKAHRPPRDLTVERLHTLRRGHYCTSKYIK